MQHFFLCFELSLTAPGQKLLRNEKKGHDINKHRKFTGGKEEGSDPGRSSLLSRAEAKETRAGCFSETAKRHEREEVLYISMYRYVLYHKHQQLAPQRTDTVGDDIKSNGQRTRTQNRTEHHVHVLIPPPKKLISWGTTCCSRCVLFARWALENP